MLIPLLFVLAVCCESSRPSRPNIIFMFGDDIGFNDFGFMGCTTTRTPVIDELVKSEGLLLWNHYTANRCSPSRSAFMSGRYPSNLGLQNLMFSMEYPVSLTRSVSTISSELKASGYSTHAVGKWHLGFQSWEYTPTYRGFESFYGFYAGYSSYYNHTLAESMTGDNHEYYDLRVNEEEAIDEVNNHIYGMYGERNRALEIIAKYKDSEDPYFLYISWQSAHSPNEAPAEYVTPYNVTSSSKNRMYGQAQMTIMDEAMAEIVDYLKGNEMWDNTLMIFASDNGGKYGRGDNFPLRGYKNSSFEGGIRTTAFVTGGYLDSSRRGKVLDDVVVSVADWYPTLLDAAGAEIGYQKSKRLFSSDDDDTRFDGDNAVSIPLDGKSIWSAIQLGTPPDELLYDEREVLLDLNTASSSCVFSSCGAIRRGSWKYLRGMNMASNSSDTGDTEWDTRWTTCDASFIRGSIGTTCYMEENGCLFNLDTDLSEQHDVGDEYPELRQHFMDRLDYHSKRAPAALLSFDSRLDFEDYDPATIKGSNFWSPFMDYNDASFEEQLQEEYRRIANDGDVEGYYFVIKASDEGTRGKSIDSVFIGILMVMVSLVITCVRIVCCMPFTATKREKALQRNEIALLDPI